MIRTRLNIIEKHVLPDCIYVGDWPLKQVNGQWVHTETGEIMKEIDLVDLLPEREKEGEK